jgi:hypothetical protein
MIQKLHESHEEISIKLEKFNMHFEPYLDEILHLYPNLAFKLAD